MNLLFSRAIVACSVVALLGCATARHVPVQAGAQASSAAQPLTALLQPSDKVVLTLVDGSKVPFVVTSVTERDVTGTAKDDAQPSRLERERIASIERLEPRREVPTLLITILAIVFGAIMIPKLGGI